MEETTITSSYEIANLFTKALQHGKPVHSLTLPPMNFLNSTFLSQVSKQEVVHTVQKLNFFKATDMNEISVLLMKKCIKEVCDPLLLTNLLKMWCFQRP